MTKETRYLETGEFLEVCKSAAGYYIGTLDYSLGYPIPNSRESVEYWPSHEKAEKALKENTWTQRANY